MNRNGKALIVLLVAAVGLWGCSQGPGQSAIQAERIKALEIEVRQTRRRLQSGGVGARPGAKENHYTGRRAGADRRTNGCDAEGNRGRQTGRQGANE